jgi:hypothetical protein
MMMILMQSLVAVRVRAELVTGRMFSCYCHAILLLRCFPQADQPAPLTDAVNILQLAMNSNCSQTAAAASKTISAPPKDLQTAAARRRLLTAAALQHAATVLHLVSSHRYTMKQQLM